VGFNLFSKTCFNANYIVLRDIGLTLATTNMELVKENLVGVKNKRLYVKHFDSNICSNAMLKTFTKHSIYISTPLKNRINIENLGVFVC
jgi:hypothetical protein